ncbi:hypothetical protein GIB67_009674 [Kingdonia uniflora]|uniref:Uncharacterized protein n=1 Tax=Kingdonia uniflora TaxID=39325 RepID=A0A7J7LAZ4_9MAGN|nr:hypothetical protein GIB67_009674 [Kingdonia uniflora]
MSTKQTQIQGHLKTVACTESLESSYFGNVREIWGDKLELAPAPIDGEWLPKAAIYALVDLMVVIFGRPKGLFKECGRRIQSGVHLVKEELMKLGITGGVREVDLQNSAIWMAGVYLMLFMQFLENKVAIELTHFEFSEAQEALVEMKSWFVRFLTILQVCESIIEMLRGQYAHSLGSFTEAAFYFLEAAKLTESKSMQAMCHIYATVSYICIGDAESSSQALDLIGPVYGIMDSFVGVREKTSVLFAYGLLLMKQNNLQEARIRLASGLRVTHQHLGNIQLVLQYLTIFGSLALTLHDTGQAREIFKSSLTLAKTLYDIPTQIWVLSVLTMLYQELSEMGNEMENSEYEREKIDDLQKRLTDARSSIQHIKLIKRLKIEARPLHDTEMKCATAGPSIRVNLDIPESIGLTTPAPIPSTRLMDIDTGRRGQGGVNCGHIVEGPSEHILFGLEKRGEFVAFSGVEKPANEYTSTRVVDFEVNSGLKGNRTGGDREAKSADSDLCGAVKTFGFNVNGRNKIYLLHSTDCLEEYVRSFARIDEHRMEDEIRVEGLGVSADSWKMCTSTGPVFGVGWGMRYDPSRVAIIIMVLAVGLILSDLDGEGSVPDRISLDEYKKGTDGGSEFKENMHGMFFVGFRRLSIKVGVFMVVSLLRNESDHGCIRGSRFVVAGGRGLSLVIRFAETFEGIGVSEDSVRAIEVFDFVRFIKETLGKVFKHFCG